MAEEVSPESKIYVKEEIEDLRKEIREEVEKVKSKATKTFTTIGIVIGLLTGLGVYGLAQNYINTVVQERLGADTVAEFNNLKIEAARLTDQIEVDATKASNFLSGLSRLQSAKPNGYARVGGIRFVWGTRHSTKSKSEDFKFFPQDGDPNEPNKYDFEECFTVITSVGGRIKKDPKGFTLDRHDDYKKNNFPITFVAIGR